MSFSSETKNELARFKNVDKKDKQAELSAIVRMAGTIQIAGLRKINIKITTELNSIARRIFKLLKKEFINPLPVEDVNLILMNIELNY